MYGVSLRLFKGVNKSVQMSQLCPNEFIFFTNFAAMKDQGLYFYGLAAATYVITSLVIAAVRWFHMCRPCDRNPRYYYPGRPAATLIYLSALVLVPYVIHPDSHTAWLLVKAYFLPVDLYFLTILLFSYFGGVKQWKKWRVPIVALGVIAGLSVLAAVAWAISGDKETSDIIENIIIGIGVIMTFVCLWAARVVIKWARQADNEDYSNPEDFPVNFARKTLAMMHLTMVLLWITAIIGNKAVMASLHIFMSFTSVWLLISALHPHRHGNPLEEQDNQDDEPDKNRKKSSALNKKTAYYSHNIADDKVQDIINAIREVVERREAFLEPHLTMQDVATRTGYNRTYVAAVFKNHLGGFFTYVNTLRLDYADEYRKTHPKASVIEISNESGFNSRTTYYAVQAKLRPDK